METDPEFHTRFKQHLVFESSKVANPFEFIAGLLSKGVLRDGCNDSETNFGVKETMVQLALMIASSKGADAIGGLIEALEESGNSELVSALQTLVVKDFDNETDGDLSEAKVNNSAEQTPTTQSESKILTEQLKTTNEFSSIGTKLINKIMSHEERDFMEQLEDHWVSKASEIVNAADFISDLEHQNVLNESDQEWKSRLEAQEKQSTAKAIKTACSMKAIGSLITAFQHSGNERILQETLDWLETSEARSMNYPIAVKSLTNQNIPDNSKLVKSAFFEQPAPLEDLEKVAVFNCQPESSTNGIFAVDFNRDQMIVYLADGTVKLWSWVDNEEKTMKFGAKVKDITCIQYDEEICVLGTANGTVYLFDSRTLEAKWLIRLGEPVRSLKFLESTLVVMTRSVAHDHFWWIDISRTDMRLLNKRLVRECSKSNNSGIFVNPDCSFLYSSNLAAVYDTKLARQITDNRGDFRWLRSPASISVLNVVDLISLKRVVLAGCANGVIAMWNDCRSVIQQTPVRTFQGHTEAIVSLCSLNGHLLSVDKSGKLLMWSGYDLENKGNMPPVPQVLADDFNNVSCLFAYERWFASSSLEDSIVNIWTLPELWLRTG